MAGSGWLRCEQMIFHTYDGADSDKGSNHVERGRSHDGGARLVEEPGVKVVVALVGLARRRTRRKVDLSCTAKQSQTSRQVITAFKTHLSFLRVLEVDSSDENSTSSDPEVLAVEDFFLVNVGISLERPPPEPGHGCCKQTID